MHDSTKAELIDSAGTAAIGVLKELFVRQRETERLEQRAAMQKEVELARAGIDTEGQRRQTGTQEPKGDVIDTLNQARSAADRYEELLNEAEEMESCDLCKQLIRGAQQRPAAEQDKLLTALSDFFSDVNSDATTEEVAERVQDNEVLMDLIRQTMGPE